MVTGKSPPGQYPPYHYPPRKLPNCTHLFRMKHKQIARIQNRSDVKSFKNGQINAEYVVYLYFRARRCRYRATCFNTWNITKQSKNIQHWFIYIHYNLDVYNNTNFSDNRQITFHWFYFLSFETGTLFFSKMYLLSLYWFKIHIYYLHRNLGSYELEIYIERIINVFKCRTVYALTRGLFRCLLPELRSSEGNKHYNNTRVRA